MDVLEYGSISSSATKKTDLLTTNNEFAKRRVFN